MVSMIAPMSREFASLNCQSCIVMSLLDLDHQQHIIYYNNTYYTIFVCLQPTVIVVLDKIKCFPGGTFYQFGFEPLLLY